MNLDTVVHSRRRIIAHMRGWLFATVLLLALPTSMPAAAELSDAEIRQLLIEQSRASYPGNCPCPYNVDRAGRRCGARSAYDKQGGYAPLCYPEDVTGEMIEEFRRNSTSSISATAPHSRTPR